jgi:hypothetical protein
MQKFLSLGNECVKIQETVDASQGMFTMNCEFFLSRVCLLRLPLAIDCLSCSLLLCCSCLDVGSRSHIFSGS